MSTAERHIEMYSGLTGLAALQHDWQQLQQRIPQATFYQSHAWFSAYLQTLEETPDKLDLVALYQNQECVGVLPLMQRQPQRSLLQPTILEIPLLTGMDLTAPPLAAGQSLASWWPLLRKTFSTRGLHHFVIRMHGVPLDDGTHAALQEMAPWQIARVQGHTCWFDCNQPAENLQQAYTTRLKKILRKGNRGLEKLGAVTFEAHSSGSGLTRAYDSFLQLEASGWKGRQGSSTALALDERSRLFHERFLFADDTTLQPQINLLKVAGKPVAAQLCIADGPALSLLKIAFDQSLSRLSPGSVLLDRLLATTCATHASDKISLITGQPWMDNWGAKKTAVADIWLFGRRSTAMLTRSALGARDRLRPLLARRAAS